VGSPFFPEFEVATRHCELYPDLWQAFTDAGDDGNQRVYFLIRWRPP
jgi:hypothetical protein